MLYELVVEVTACHIQITLDHDRPKSLNINNEHIDEVIFGQKSDFSIGYVKVDGLGETLLLPEQNPTKIDREHANFTCFENTIPRQNSLPQHDTSNDEAFRESKSR